MLTGGWIGENLMDVLAVWISQAPRIPHADRHTVRCTDTNHGGDDVHRQKSMAYHMAYHMNTKWPSQSGKPDNNDTLNMLIVMIVDVVVIALKCLHACMFA